ncbi:SDR family oxidoreductase [Streptomyces sp. NBC_01231]|nr:SDR family oxidoreductase [Streptomyces sp. NBC_01231]
MNAPVAFVAGSSKGLGAGIAKAFARTGHHVVVTYFTDQQGGEKTLQTIINEGGKGTLCHLDVTNESSVQAAYAMIENHVGRLDSLVITAVREIPKPIDDASFDEWRKVLSTKLDGAFLLTKYGIPLLRRSENASVTYITSIDGERPKGDFIAYQTGTAGLIALTKAHSVYLTRKYGIRVNAVAPGPVRTPLWDQLGGDDESMWERFAESTPVKRIATVEDVGQACLFLALDSKKFLNGVFLSVDGGDQWT